jgi:hypothetical protein
MNTAQEDSSLTCQARQMQLICSRYATTPTCYHTKYKNSNVSLKYVNETHWHVYSMKFIRESTAIYNYDRQLLQTERLLSDTKAKHTHSDRHTFYLIMNVT